MPMVALPAGSLVEDRVELSFGPSLKNAAFTLYNGFFRGAERMNLVPRVEDKRFRGTGYPRRAPLRARRTRPPHCRGP